MRLVVFGPGYTASRIVAAVADRAVVTAIGRDAFEDDHAVRFAVGHATHILSSVPPGEDDPVLARYGAAIAESGAWIGYLSSTGVYGDSGGAWVDEGASLNGRRGARLAADGAWLALPGTRVFRLPGIYGPGRSALERVAGGQAHRVAVPGQVFSRVHVDDIVTGVVAAFDAPAGAYNLADDLPAPQNDVMEAAAALLGMDAPPFVALDRLSDASRAFYAENRRVANGKAKRVLGWRPRYPDYRFGLRALSAATRPTSTSADPAAGSSDQR